MLIGSEGWVTISIFIFGGSAILLSTREYVCKMRTVVYATSVKANC
jgi:hypothetical protein